jgi:hypothetical protein
MEKMVTATMKKATAIVLSVVIAAAFWWAVLGNASGGKKYKPYEPRVISVRDVYITGEWKDYIKIEDGDYILEDNDSFPHIGIRLTLIKPYEGTAENPARTLRLIALSKSGNSIGKEFWIDSRDKFNDFVSGDAGVSTLITFTALMYARDTWFPTVTGFDARTTGQ